MTHALYNGLKEHFGQLAFTIVEDATLPRLAEALAAAPYDVVHICGHAQNVTPDEQAIILHAEEGRSCPDVAEVLAEQLKLVKISGSFAWTPAIRTCWPATSPCSPAYPRSTASGA